jgi:hypothetical protein
MSAMLYLLLFKNALPCPLIANPPFLNGLAALPKPRATPESGAIFCARRDATCKGAVFAW